jgi:hypothetical protein
LDWSLSELGGEETPEPVFINGEQVGGCEHTVVSVSTYAVMLNEVYCGPSVRKGQPVVYLRTALIPRGVSTIKATGDGEVWPVLKECKLSFNCTSLVAHPTRPYVVAAGEDGAVRILLPHSRFPAASEKDSQQTEDITSVDHARSIDLPDERVILARGNHFNVWRRSPVTGQLVSISKVETAAAMDVHSMPAALAEQLSALEGESAKVLPPKNDDWLQDVFRDIGGGVKRNSEQQIEDVVDEIIDEEDTLESTDHSTPTENHITLEDDTSHSNNDADSWTSHPESSSALEETVESESTHGIVCLDDDSFGALAPLCIDDLMGGGGGDKENIQREGEDGMFSANTVPTTFSIFSKAPTSSAATNKNKRPFSSTIPHFTPTTSRTTGKGQPLQEAQALLARKHGVNSLSSRVGVSKAPGPVNVLATTCPTMFSVKPATATHSSSNSNSGGKVDFKSVMGEASSIFSGVRAGGAGLKNVRNGNMTTLGLKPAQSSKPSLPVFTGGNIKSSGGSGLGSFLTKKK